jgi:hypothetical protein
MKSLRIFFGLTVLLGALSGAACGPEETYCGAEKLTCAQVKIRMDQDRAKAEAEAAAKADAGDPNAKEASIMTGAP